MTTNYQIQMSFMVFDLIVEEFKKMDLSDKYYLTNVGVKRSLAKIEKYQEIFYGTVMQFSDSLPPGHIQRRAQSL